MRPSCGGASGRLARFRGTTLWRGRVVVPRRHGHTSRRRKRIPLERRRARASGPAAPRGRQRRITATLPTSEYDERHTKIRQGGTGRPSTSPGFSRGSAWPHGHAVHGPPPRSARLSAHLQTVRAPLRLGRVRMNGRRLRLVESAHVPMFTVMTALASRCGVPDLPTDPNAGGAGIKGQSGVIHGGNSPADARVSRHLPAAVDWFPGGYMCAGGARATRRLPGASQGCRRAGVVSASRGAANRSSG